MQLLDNRTRVVVLSNQNYLTAARKLVNAGLLDDFLPTIIGEAESGNDSVIGETPYLVQLVQLLWNASIPVEDSLCSPHFGRISAQYLFHIIITLFTVIINTLTCTVFIRRAMRNPTNTLLLAIAVSDLLTVILPLPIYLTYLTSTAFETNMDITKGYSMTYLTVFLPTACHIASIWFTVLLAIQRFIYVQFPLKASTFLLCRQLPVCVAVIITTILAFLPSVPQMVSTKYYHVLTYDIVPTGAQTQYFPNSHIKVQKCTLIEPHIYFTLMLIRGLFVNVLPCVILTLLTIHLTLALNRFSKNRKRLLQHSIMLPPQQQPQAETGDQSIHVATNGVQSAGLTSSASAATNSTRLLSNRSVDKDSTSHMLLVILGIFLCVEVPTTIGLCVYYIQRTNSPSWVNPFLSTCNSLVVLSYPANFFVYLVMSKPFRSTFKSTFPKLWNFCSAFKWKRNRRQIV